jgi:HK97 family phage major capsid protein
MDSYIKRQQELRMQAWEQAKALLDTAATENRDLSTEEQQTYERINTELDERTATIERFQKDMERENRARETFVPEAYSEIRTENMPTDKEMLRKLVTGEVRSYRFEARDLGTVTATDGPELVPQGFYDVLQRKLEYAGPMTMADVVTVLNTESGNDIKVPVETSRSAATATAEGAVFGESDPQFTTLTLRAHKYGALVQVSSELLNEAGIDLVGYLSDQFAVAIGTAVNSALTLGGGTTEPAGIVPGAGAGKTGGTTVGGAFTANDLIDLAHAVDSAYARRPKAGFMLSRSTLGAVRKLQDGGGNYLYNPVINGPDQLLGYPIFENPDIAAVGTGVKSVLFGDFGAYHTRIVGAGVDVARSDDFAFGNDLITFRASIRLDGALGGGGSDAVKYFIGGAS